MSTSPTSSVSSGVAGAPKKNPTVKAMVLEAVTNHRERSGCSRQAMQKYLEGRFFYDMSDAKTKARVTKAVHDLLADGSIINFTGVGASGSFKLGEALKKQDKMKMLKEKKEAAKKEEEEEAAKKKVTKKDENVPKKKAPAKKEEKAPKKKASSKEEEEVPKKKAPAKKRQPLDKVADADNKKADAKTAKPKIKSKK